MSPLTYLPTLLKIMEHLCAFMQTHEVVIKRYLDSDQTAAFDALLAACMAFRAIYPLIAGGI